MSSDPVISTFFMKKAIDVRAGVAELAKGAGLKIPSLVVHGFESHPPHQVMTLFLII